MKLLVYEHISGGGFANEKIPTGVLCEGFGMLSNLISDFKRAGHNVTTLIDSRLAKFSPPLNADKIVSVSSSRNLEKALKKFLKLADSVYFVAPESDQTLQKLVEKAEDLRKVTLNCQVASINTAANKTTTYETLKKSGIAFPESLTFNVNETAEHVGRKVRDFGFPLVFKPLTGVACQGISVVHNENEIKLAINRIKGESSTEFFLVQQLLAGIAASVSLISIDMEATPISLNGQLLTLESASSKLSSGYYGGVVPLCHSMEKKAFETAKKAVESIRGLVGYVGVDMVLTRKGPVVIEINPRLTTSYVGLTKVVDFSIGQAIIDAVLGHRLPGKIVISGCTFFSKVEVDVPTYEELLKTYKLGEVVAPPFPVGDKGKTYVLLASEADELEKAKAGLKIAVKRLNNIISKGYRN